MSDTQTVRPISRRTALGGVAGVAALGLAASPVRAQTASLADHPLTGTWLAMGNPPLPDVPQFAAPSLFAADGTVLLVFPLLQKGPQGLIVNSPVVGVWEPDGDRRGHFTAVQVLTDDAGTFVGTLTIDGHPEVSEDGKTFIDDGSRVMLTMRDAAGAITNQVMPTGQPAGPPVTATRMAVGAPGFPESGMATPTA